MFAKSDSQGGVNISYIATCTYSFPVHIIIKKDLLNLASCNKNYFPLFESGKKKRSTIFPRKYEAKQLN